MMMYQNFIVRGCWLLLAALLGTMGVQAQNVYHVRAGATGSGNGSDWNNAYSSLPSTLQRGATYYIADGSYSGYTFDDVESGSLVISIKKATISDHGASTGWQNAYGDGQAIFNGDFIMQRDYYTIDGQTRNESQWNDEASYGFRITSVYGQNSSFPPGGDHIVVQYASLGGRYSETYYSGMSEAVYCGGFAGAFHHWTIRRCFLHNSTHTIVQFAGVYDMAVEYCFIGPGWGKEAIRGQINCYNVTIRHNIFYNASQTDPQDSTSGITAEIALWDGSNFNNNEIYGNDFYNSKSGGRNGVIVVGGNGSSWAGPGTTGTKVYNNTFAGVAERAVFGEILLNGSGNEAKNNLFYNCGGNRVNASSTANNLTATVDPFVDYSGRDFRITSSSQARNAGAALNSVYSTDRLGTLRGADGAWDVGAYEYVSSGPDVSAPSVVGVAAGGITTNTATITFTTSESARSGVEYGPTTAYGSSVTNSTLTSSHSLLINGLSPNTTYHYRVHATDAAGNRTNTGNFTFQTSQVPAPDTTPPVVSGLAAGNVGGTTATISFTTSEPARSGVQYGLTTGYGGSATNVSLATSHSFAVTGLSPDTVYHYRVSATDAAGNGTVSGDAVFQTAALDTLAPTISLTAPGNGATVSNTVTLAATASDNVGVVGVVFLVDGAVVGTEDTTAPYSIAWDPATIANGTHTVSARARDAAGNQTTSGTVSITVVSAPSGELKVGDRVAVNSDPSLRVRSTSALAGTVVGEQFDGALGTIIAGPVNADGFTWWQIDYDNSPDGWSIEGNDPNKWLIRDTSARPAAPAGLRLAAP